jgi:5-methylcytosine-specific restriction endonuclease McrA
MPRTRNIARKKAEQLGAPIGTASNRLRKMVMLALLQEVGRDFCYRCALRIETPQDLTLDHKVPWLDQSADLFWDLKNIAFSHASCNSSAARTRKGRKFGPSPVRKIGPGGTAWCTRHAAFLPVASFDKNRAKWSGLQSFCRECQSGLPRG